MRMPVIAVAALFLGTAAFAQHDHNAKPPAHKPAPAHQHAAAKPTIWKMICPVTGEKIASVKASGGHSTYKGKTYLFCCPSCKPTFDKNPDKIIADANKGKFQKM